MDIHRRPVRPLVVEVFLDIAVAHQDGHVLPAREIKPHAVFGNSVMELPRRIDRKAQQRARAIALDPCAEGYARIAEIQSGEVELALRAHPGGVAFRVAVRRGKTERGAVFALHVGCERLRHALCGVDLHLGEIRRFQHRHAIRSLAGGIERLDAQRGLAGRCAVEIPVPRPRQPEALRVLLAVGDLPEAVRVLAQTRLLARDGQILLYGRRERARETRILVPAEDGQLPPHSRRQRPRRDALDGHRGVMPRVLAGEVFHLVHEVPARTRYVHTGLPPAHLRLEEIGLAAVVDRPGYMPVVEALDGVDSMVDCRHARLEPPVVRARAARLYRRRMAVVALELPEYLVAHHVNAIARAHALGAVEVELVEVAGVVDVREAVGQLVCQGGVRLRIESDVALVQIVGLRASRIGAALLRAERAALYAGERVRHLVAADPRVLYELVADPEHVAVGRIREHRRMALHGFFVDEHLRILLAERRRERVRRVGDELLAADGAYPRILRRYAGRKSMDARAKPGRVDLLHARLHRVYAAGEGALADRIVPEHGGPVRVVDVGESAALYEVDPVVYVAVVDSREHVAPAGHFAFHRPRAAGIALRRAGRDRHGLELFAERVAWTCRQDSGTARRRERLLDQDVKARGHVRFALQVAGANAHRGPFIAERVHERAAPLVADGEKIAEAELLRLAERTLLDVEAPAAVERDDLHLDFADAGRETEREPATGTLLETTRRHNASAGEDGIDERDLVGYEFAS